MDRGAWQATAFEVARVRHRKTNNMISFLWGLKRGPVSTQRGGMGREMGGRFKREGIYVHLWLIHVEVWQKTTKFCKAIILQFKNK